MASFSQILFFVGIGLIAAATKWGMGWALGIGFIALLIPCAIPIGRLLFRPYR